MHLSVGREGAVSCPDVCPRPRSTEPETRAHSACISQMINQSLECGTCPRFHGELMKHHRTKFRSQIPSSKLFPVRLSSGRIPLGLPLSSTFGFQGNWKDGSGEESMASSRAAPQGSEGALASHGFYQGWGQLLEHTYRPYRDMLVISDPQPLHRPQYTSNIPFSLQNQVDFVDCRNLLPFKEKENKVLQKQRVLNKTTLSPGNA